MAFLPHIRPWPFLKKLFKRVGDNDAGGRAAQLSYYFVFALFPFLFFLVTLAAYLPVQGALEGLLGRIDPLVPEQAMRLVRG
ncbi:MAG TPA: YhjD/YihY/BrkB family envelope integrity protein, partial [Myxococcales bacterium]